ncbi:MAG: RNA methyltransferase [Bdellovibrionia bacterium]
MTQNCEIAGVCSGCLWIGRPYEEQVRSKADSVQNAFREHGIAAPPVEFVSAGQWGLRDRADLTLENGRLGLYDVSRTGIAEMHRCPMMSGPLEAWLMEFRKTRLPEVKKGSLRLRVSPSGLRGVWLDFANLDVKALLDDGRWLNALLESGAAVEIGQRRKRLVRTGDRLRLADPKPELWFQAFVPEPIPLWSFVGSFTQPGFEANRALLETVTRTLVGVDSPVWLELGSGIGNFTVLLARRAVRILALELDELSVQALELNVRNNLNVEVVRADYRKAGAGDRILEAGAVLCDPPRSGLGEFLNELPKFSALREVIYVSCFLDSFIVDAERLGNLGFRPVSVAVVDQFPQSPHTEIVSRFSKI